MYNGVICRRAAVRGSFPFLTLGVLIAPSSSSPKKTKPHEGRKLSFRRTAAQRRDCFTPSCLPFLRPFVVRSCPVWRAMKESLPVADTCFFFLPSFLTHLREQSAFHAGPGLVCPLRTGCARRCLRCPGESRQPLKRASCSRPSA